ncbi:unnamed protein product [Microthlaspi erraticum]|uniref:Uncharacterized protein n=1 Tax=Microthlaspi erraticum TaxID=1685480 RepID=A0A6D2KYF4_9BRAS|nr:unnamed protein product [Microthlaspi erraticum]
MFCQNAFRQNSPPDGFMELASEVADHAGRLPLGLNILGSTAYTLMDMISPSLTCLYLSDIPTLVELPSSFQNLSKLETLIITDCINLETLPNGINFESLDLDLSGCSRLRSFPDISTNISYLI